MLVLTTHGNSCVTLGGHLLVLQFLLAQPKVNINAQDRFHNTPLMEAIANKHTEVATWLSNNGANVTHRNLGQKLCEAATKGR